MLRFYCFLFLCVLAYNCYSQTCLTPTNPTSTGATTNSINLLWDDVGAISYEVKYRTSNSSVWQSLSSSSNFFSFSGLSSGTQYFWQVRSACSEDGSSFSDYSSLLSFTTTGNSSCIAPSGINAGSISTQSATVSWNVVSNAIGYQIFYRENSGKYYTSLNVESNIATLEGLKPGTHYVWYVKSRCSNTLLSNGSTIGNFTTAGDSPCPAPTNLNSTALTNNSVDLSWSDISGALTYTIRYRAVTSPGYRSVVSNTNNVHLSDLSSGTNYVWYVLAECSSLISTNSNINNFTTTGDSPCPAPENLNANNVTATTASLIWNVVDGAESYYIKYRRNDSRYFNVVTTTSNTVNLTNLSSETDYVFVVQAICSNILSSIYSSAGFFTTASTCPVPNNLVVSDIMDTSVRLSWNVTTGAESYSISYKPVHASTWTNKTSSSTFLTITGLLPGTDYNWRIRANCTDKSSDYSIIMNFTTTGEPPCGQPQNLVASNISENTAVLGWNAANGAVEYIVRYRPDNSINWSESTVATNSLSLAGLVSGTSYVWTVSTVCVNTSSAYSIGNFTTTGFPPCQAPVNLSSANVGSSSADLQWDSVNGAAEYEIHYKVTSGNNWFIIESNLNSATLTNLVSGTQYSYYVVTNCSTGQNSANSEVRTFTTGGSIACAPPQNLSALNITNSSADLVWNAVSGASSYVLSYRSASGSTYTKVTTNVNTRSLAGLAAGTQYVWYVNAVCNGVQSGNSVIANFTTTGTPACQAPSNLTNSNISTNTAVFSWDPVPGALDYELRYRKDVGGTYASVSVNSTSTEISGLAAGTEYVWYVRSRCSSSLYSVISPIGRFTTLPAESQSTSADLFSLTNTNNSIGIQFKDNESADGYILVYNASGKIIKRIDNMTSTEVFRSVDISPAYYNSLLIVKIITNDGEFTKKIIFK